MGSNDWTCEPRQHNFTETTRNAVRVKADGEEVEYVEPSRLFCTRCGWVRDLPRSGVNEVQLPGASG